MQNYAKIFLRLTRFKALELLIIWDKYYNRLSNDKIGKRIGRSREFVRLRLKSLLSKLRTR